MREYYITEGDRHGHVRLFTADEVKAMAAAYAEGPPPDFGLPPIDLKTPLPHILWQEFFTQKETAMHYEPIDVAVALSLYAYNVSAYERANKIFMHFGGECADLDELIRKVDHFPATELAPPSALVYVNHALEKYGAEAKQRNEINYDPRPLDEVLNDPKYSRRPTDE